MPADAYARLGKLARKFGRLYPGCPGNTCNRAPGTSFAVKPNRAELEAWAGTPLQTELDIAAALCRLVREGTELAVVSLGAEGAMAVGQGRLWRVRPPRVQAVNTVGSGDAFAAGLAVGLERNLPLAEVLALACASGTANALHPETGHVPKSPGRPVAPYWISAKEVSHEVGTCALELPARRKEETIVLDNLAGRRAPGTVSSSATRPAARSSPSP